MTPPSQTGTGIDVAVEKAAPDAAARNGDRYLHLLGDSIRAARARRGMTRKMLAKDSGVSERFLAQLESGAGNASILVLRQIARALDLPLEAMLPNGNGHPATLTHAIELLQRLDPAKLAEAQELLLSHFGNQRTDRKSIV